MGNANFVASGGWSYTVPVINSTSWSSTSQGVTCNFSSGYTFQDPSGSRHNLELGTTSYSSNGQYLCSNPVINGGDQRYVASLVTTITAGNVNPPAQISDGDGTVYYFSNPQRYGPISGFDWSSIPDYVEDRNGNKISLTAGTAAGSFTITDTAGRTISSTGLGPTGQTNTLSVSGATYKVAWISTSPNYTVPLTYSYRVTGGFCSTVPAVTGSESVVSTITLPNNQQYTLYYGTNNPHGFSNPYGLLSEIDYPTGGWVRYTWKVSDTYSEGLAYDATSGQLVYQGGCHIEMKTPVIATRSVGFGSSSTPALTQTFTYNTNWSTDTGSGPSWSSKTTTVSTTDNIRGITSQTVYAYTPMYAGGSNNPYVFDFTASQLPVESSVDYFDWGKNTNSDPFKIVAKTWQDVFDLLTETTTLNDIATSQTVYTYTSTNPTQVQTEQKGPVGGQLQKTAWTYQSFPTTPVGGTIADRPSTEITYDASNSRVAETDYTYDAYGANGMTGVVATGHDDTNFPTTYASRGNVTTETRKCFPIPPSTQTCGDAATSYTYDETGQVLTKTDPRGNATTYSYADSYTVLSGGVNISYTPTGNTNANLSKITDTLSHTESFTYDFNNGQLTASTDQNGRSTKYLYNDAFSRPTLVNYPDQGQTTVSYNDTAPAPTVTACRLIANPSPNVCTTTVMDGMGHVTQNQLTTDPDGVDSTDITVDGSGRIFTMSNPHRSTGLPTDGTTTYLYDALGRSCAVGRPDGTAVSGACPTTAPARDMFTSYSGSNTTVTDESGKASTSTVDALGRLTTVLEDPTGVNYETDYQYDGLSNLTTVTQKGSNSASARTRSFQYDSFSRLTSSQNPEAGTISYAYDPNGNLVTKIAPKAGQTGTAQTTTTYTYDVLNRLTKKAFANPASNPELYSYDGATLTGCPGPAPPTISSPTNRTGRRSAMCASYSASSWSYDAMGRVGTEARSNKGSGGGVSHNAVYTYNLDGSLKTLTYPSGDVVTYTVLGAGRPTQVTDSVNNFVTSATYAPHGALTGMTSGTSIATTNIYNQRLQPILLSAKTQSGTAIFSHCYDFHLGVAINNTPCSFSSYTTGDNGNLFQQIDNVDSTRSAAYLYDSLNRVMQANTITTTGPNCWGETYTIDAWSNLTNRSGVSGMNGCATEPLSAVANTMNQLSGISYDAAGNVTNDGNGNTPTYDPENRMATNVGVTYSYDADGFRMRKSSGTMYWPGSSGEVLSEADLTGSINEEYVYFNGERIARVDRPTGTAHYYFSDHLSSTSVISDPSGTVQAAYYYFPYGGIGFTTGSDPNHYKFAGKEWDSESGLDNFGARYNASSVGRFMTPDPLSATQVHLINPQRWNMYSYVVNNPLIYVDPDGMDAIAVNFTKEVPGGGHEGIISVQADGSAVYARFGPVHEKTPADQGKVDVMPLSSVEFKSDGLPTDASYKQLVDQVAKIEKQDPSTVRLNYIKTSDAETAALNAWIQRIKDASDAGKAPYYNVTSQNCATFCKAGLIQGNAIPNGKFSNIPNTLFNELTPIATENYANGQRSPKEVVTHKITQFCYTDENGQTVCQ